MNIREPQKADWPQLFKLANQSIAHVPGVPTQEDWWNNRQNFDETVGIRRHLAALTDDENIIGYMAVESAQNDGVFRLFVVTIPEYLSTLGETLYGFAMTHLRELDAQQVWFTEYAEDNNILEFARAHGFQEHRRFSTGDGLEVLSTYKEAPF